MTYGCMLLCLLGLSVGSLTTDSSAKEVEVMARVSAKQVLVLQHLRVGERFGLQLVEESGGQLKRGSIYVLLGRLEESGLVSSRQESRPPREGGMPRRLYRLTGEGESVLTWWESAPSGWLGRLAMG